MKDYLNFEGLSHFFDKLLSKFVQQDDVITDAEIDEICDAVIYTAEEVEL